MISIALATYNGEKYIKEQIDSILNQSFSDFELVVCDDCSKDSTVYIIEKYCKSDKRIKLFINENNLGFKKNFEKAISLCSGECIALCDQDDIWEKKHLEILLKNIGDNYYCSGAINYIDEKGTLIGSASDLFFDVAKKTSLQKEKMLKSTLMGRSKFQGAASLLSRNFLSLAIPVPENVLNHDTWFMLLSCSIGKFCFVNEVVNNYRKHSNEVTGNELRVLSGNPILLTLRNIIKHKKRGIINDRYYHCDNILKRADSLLDENTKSLLIKVKKYHYYNSKSFIFRLINFPFFLKNFDLAYGVRSRKNDFVRVIKYIVGYGV